MPARVGRRTAERDTQQLDRDLKWPARVLARAEALQGEPGPADRDTVTADEP